MPTTINSENAKQIRAPMEVYVGFSTRDPDIDLTFNLDVAGKAQDTNLTASLDSDWQMRKLTDFQGDGYPLDGSCEFYDPSLAASSTAGKIGIRTDVGGYASVQQTDAQLPVEAYTVRFSSGSGTLIATSATGYTIYPISAVVVVPVTGNNSVMSFSIESDDPTRRVELESIVPGVEIEFTQDDLVRVGLSLRADLSPDPTLPASEIEVQAYWPTDISEAIGQMPEGAPIWYYAGYQGDFCTQRQFYLSGQSIGERNLVTLRGVDAIERLDSYTVPLQLMSVAPKDTAKSLYNKMTSMVTSSGVTFASRQAAPGALWSGNDPDDMMLLEKTARDHIAYLMNYCRTTSFWPTYVDAGIPTATWNKPSAKWDIYEDDCGDVARAATQRLGTITSTGEWPMETVAVANWDGNPDAIPEDDPSDPYYRDNIQVAAGQRVNLEFTDTYWCKFRVSNQKTRIRTSLQKLQFIAKNAGVCRVVGWGVTIYQSAVGPFSLDVTGGNGRGRLEMEPIIYGRLCRTGPTRVYPDANSVFSRSNITGSFTWKGDPRMQPRDVFNFHRLDGTVEVCTIETIELTHEGGGTTAEITYRKGVC